MAFVNSLMQRLGIGTAEPPASPRELENDQFRKVLIIEQADINARRKVLDRLDIVPAYNDDRPRDFDMATFNTTGVSLSGGGIRSAAFCLGALQSLAVRVGMDRIDYLSTVSGGGYIGASVSAGMAVSGAFPFAARNEFKDNEAIGHLRDLSNYLFPRGRRTFVDVIAVILRGLATNCIFVLAAIFFAAWLTLVAFPTKASLDHGSFLPNLVRQSGGPRWIVPSALVTPGHFQLTFLLLGLLSAFLLCWAIWRSRALAKGCDVRGSALRFTHALIIGLILVALLDFQPVAIKGIIFLRSRPQPDLKYLQGLLAAATPFAAGTAFFANKIARFLKLAGQKAGGRAFLGRAAAYMTIWIAALILPLLVWLSYVLLCAIGFSGGIGSYGLPKVVMNVLTAMGAAFGQVGLGGVAKFFIVPLPTGPETSSVAMCLYGWLAAIFFFVTLWFNPNANSLHRLYRDKLSKAFLFDPSPGSRCASGPDEGDLKPMDAQQLHDISPPRGGPYHLINAALNLQNSRHANRRGRNADFFLFSSRFVGSDATGYVSTAVVERQDPHIDLATAMAISGAAISSNMGSASIAPLAPSLALLNFRLGYWLPNPRYLLTTGSIRDVLNNLWRRVTGLWTRSSKLVEVSSDDLWSDVVGRSKELWRYVSGSAKLYLISEMLGLLDENHPLVYVTDGGHIENLGLYQLLKRRCRVIVVVDAEADPNMEFHALSVAERYARIDLGVRIDLPWQKIGEVAREFDATGGVARSMLRGGGPHSAVGLIQYPSGDPGLLLYVKASLSGDESDYVLNYKLRNPAFPHEFTGDQLFSEEQFEVYRSLGFHAAEGLFDNAQELVWSAQFVNSFGPGNSADNVRDAIKRALNGY